MVVIAENRENSSLRLQALERAPERIEIAMHRVGPGEVIASEKDQVRMLAIDGIDGEVQPREIFIAIDVEVADLACDHIAMRLAQSAHRQIDVGDIDFVDRLAPYPME